MPRLFTGRHALLLAALAFAMLFVVPPAYAQTGVIRGTVVDGAGEPISQALVTIEFRGGITRKYEVRTNEQGEFIQAGLQPGNYEITASHDTLGSRTFPARIRLAGPTELHFVLGGGGAMSEEDAARDAALRAAFAEGVAARNAGDYDTAIAKFTEAAMQVPSCPDCYYNIGYSYTQKKEYEQAEEAFLKAVELLPTYVEAYNGLATVYNAMQEFDKAQEAGAKAAELATAGATEGGGTAGAEAEYNQGVIHWNAGQVTEAEEHFQTAIRMKPDHAKAHYQLGMAFLNEGKIPDAIKMFERYLQLDPEGEFAEMATNILKQIK